MLAVVRVRARSLAWSIRFCIAGVGDGWMDDMASEFVVHRLEHLSEGAREVAKQGGRVMVRGCAIKTSRIIEDTKTIIGTENYSQLMLNLLKKEENQMKIQEQRLPSELRSSLVDWMFDIGGECAFKTETVHQAVGIVDRALSHGLEEDHSPQVLAITALRVAAEFEDGDAPPSLYDMYTDATGDEFTEKEISDIVDHLLRTLQFNWYFPSSHLFISKLSQMTDAKPMTIHLSHYLNDLLLVSGNPGGQFYPASVIASACCAAAQQFLGLDTWQGCLVGITGYSVDQLESLIKYITRLHKNARDTENQAVFNKYLEPEFYCVAMLDQEQPLRSKVILEYFNAENVLVKH